MYTIRGKIAGRTVEVTWDNGRLSGDEFAVEAVILLAKNTEGQPIGPPSGPFNSHDHLRHGWVVGYLLNTFVLDEFIEATGTIPDPPGTIPGAIH